MEARDFVDLHWLLDIIQSSNIGIVVVDREMHVELFNRFMQVHSGISPDIAIGKPLLELFPELSSQWLERRVRSVLELGIPVYTTWEERPYLFHFPLRLPIHHQLGDMYQNVMLVPLHDVANRVQRVGIVVYDVTESALARINLEAARVELQQLSRIDRLTGLWNRGYWEERLREEFARAGRTEEEVVLVMFDIDHFKRINDTYGHAVGDDAIRLVGRLLKAYSRDVDICGRYGGEEFAVLLPETGLNGAMTFCERLRETIARQVIETAAGPLQFTISLGAAAWCTDLVSVTNWIERADQALYAAKHGGRNQTRLYDGDR
jgi:diguanylate cyclase (GGDEF)-like protein